MTRAEEGGKTSMGNKGRIRGTCKRSTTDSDSNSIDDHDNNTNKQKQGQQNGEVQVQVQMQMQAEMSVRQRIRRHWREVSGKVLIPEEWGKEDLLKDLVDDYSSFDAFLAAPTRIALARQALIAHARRPSSSSSSSPSSSFRIQGTC